MNNFGEYVTPEQAVKLDQPSPFTLEEYQEMAKINSQCENCDEKEWRMVGLGLCFSCVTGESDASDDYELIEGE